MQARLYFADRDRLLPGESCLCEARFTEAAPAVFGDRFVIRAFSPLRTVAGGIVLNPLGVNMRRSDSGFAERCRMLSALIPASDAQRICIQLACTEGAQAGATFSRLRVLTNLEAKALEEALRSLSDKRLLCCVDKEQRVYMAEALMSGLCAACEDAVSAHHRRYPEKPGIKRGELASGWGKGLTPKLVQIVPARLLVQGRLVADGDYLRLPAHAPALNKEQALSREALLAAYTQAGLSPPNRNALIDTLKIPVKDAVLLFEALRASGQLVRVSEDLWYAAEHLAAAEAALRHCLLTRDSIDVAGFREATGLSRKYIVPLLEYFDLRKLTLRIGDKRILRQPLHPTRNEHGKSSPTPVPLQGCEDTSLQGECETL
jgi:selenocysteine-specific elongation factor